jgi:hypothetical protein
MCEADEHFLNGDPISCFTLFWDQRLFCYFLLSGGGHLDRSDLQINATISRNFHQAVLDRRSFFSKKRLRFK